MYSHTTCVNSKMIHTVSNMCVYIYTHYIHQTLKSSACCFTYMQVLSRQKTATKWCESRWVVRESGNARCAWGVPHAGMHGCSGIALHAHVYMYVTEACLEVACMVAVMYASTCVYSCLPEACHVLACMFAYICMCMHSWRMRCTCARMLACDDSDDGHCKCAHLEPRCDVL